MYTNSGFHKMGELAALNIKGTNSGVIVNENLPVHIRLITMKVTTAMNKTDNGELKFTLGGEDIANYGDISMVNDTAISAGGIISWTVDLRVPAGQALGVTVETASNTNGNRTGNFEAFGTYDIETTAEVLKKIGGNFDAHKDLRPNINP